MTVITHRPASKTIDTAFAPGGWTKGESNG